MKFLRTILSIVAIVGSSVWSYAGVGDPQIKTDHPWYPGELAFSNFERLAETQAIAYEKATGRKVDNDEDRALAAWYWRNLHFAHGEEGRADLFDEGFEKSDWNREYWHGLFAHGFALCGTTHAQWTAELDTLLGPYRSRSVGVSGHNSFEVFLKGGSYGDSGRWALLDHDLSTVVFDEDGKRLLSIEDLVAELNRLGNPDYRSERQRGWRIAGLHRDDMGVFKSYRVAEPAAGYAGPPPMVHLRKGETLRRYFQPGLEDGLTFVFWGRNYRRGDIPGPERSRTWVNQPENMFEAERDAGHHDGQARYGNAVYIYRPNFADGSYREALVNETDDSVTLEFSTPYVIAATPPVTSDWGIYQQGCRNGLTMTGIDGIKTEVSTDRGVSWGISDTANDLTDLVKGHQQYWLRLHASPQKLAASDLVITTVCQLNPAILPRLHDGENRIHFQASGRALVSAGPNRDQALAHCIDGELGSSSVTLELASPRGEKVVGLHAASHNQSGSPPNPDVRYRIDYSLDGGSSWRPIVDDRSIQLNGSQPKDHWSQSFTYGSLDLDSHDGPVQIRFRNDGGKKYRRVEAHLVYQTPGTDATTVRFGWTTNEQKQDAELTFATDHDPAKDWLIDTGESVTTRWVEMSVDP